MYTHNIHIHVHTHIYCYYTYIYSGFILNIPVAGSSNRPVCAFVTLPKGTSGP